MFFGSKKISITTTDHERILYALEKYSDQIEFEQSERIELRRYIDRARKVDPDKIPKDIVTMESRILLKDLGDASSFRYQLVLPPESDPEHGRISVLSSIGKKILGSKVGSVLECRVAGGLRYLQIREIERTPVLANKR